MQQFCEERCAEARRHPRTLRVEAPPRVEPQGRHFCRLGRTQHSVAYVVSKHCIEDLLLTEPGVIGQPRKWTHTDDLMHGGPTLLDRKSYAVRTFVLRWIFKSKRGPRKLLQAMAHLKTASSYFPAQNRSQK